MPVLARCSAVGPLVARRSYQISLAQVLGWGRSKTPGALEDKNNNKKKELLATVRKDYIATFTIIAKDLIRDPDVRGFFFEFTDKEGCVANKYRKTFTYRIVVPSCCKYSWSPDNRIIID